MESAHLAIPQTWNRFAYVLNNPLVIVDPNGEGWFQLDGSDTLYWDDRVNSQSDADRLYRNRKAVYLPPGTIRIVTNSSIPGLIGHTILLEEGRMIFDLGVKPKPITELEFYGGNGEKFLLAYFKFALENAVLGYVGAKAVDAVKALYQLAKAKRAGKAALEVLEAAKRAEAAGAKASEYSEYLDVTRRGSVANRATNVTRSEFEQNLTESGWTRSVSKDGKVSIFEKAGARYVVREGAKTTGGTSADYYKAGSRSIDLKIRLRQP